MVRPIPALFLPVITSPLLLLAFWASASAVVIDASDRGNFRSDGRHSSVNQNTITGFLDPNQHRSFFLFDLSGLAGTVEDATLRLEAEFFQSAKPSQMLDVFDVSASAAALGTDYPAPPPNAAGQAIFDDLGTGSVYSSFVFEPSDVGSVLDIPLDAQAVSDIDDALGDMFAVGVRMREPLVGTIDIVRFGENTPGTHQLVLTLSEPPSDPAVPEPLHGFALALLGILLHTSGRNGGPTRPPGRFRRVCTVAKSIGQEVTRDIDRVANK